MIHHTFGWSRCYSRLGCRYWSRCLLLSLFYVLPTMAFALGFGEVKLHSYIDEPMDAEIELLGAENYEPERILVSLASAQEFKRAALSRPFLLSQLQFQVLRTAASTILHVTSQEPIHQPYLEFLIDLSWPGGRLVRGYTLLLDPAPPGTPPLHARRPVVLPRHINKVVMSPEMAVASASASGASASSATGVPNNFTQQNFTQQNTWGQQILSHNTEAPEFKSHQQQRFEKLFDDKNGEANPHHDVAPMTIVSASDTAAAAPSSRPPAEPVVVSAPGMNTAAIAAARESQALVQHAQTESLSRHSQNLGQNHLQIQKNRVDPLDKIQWMLIAVAASILLLCATLIVIFARRHKQSSEKIEKPAEVQGADKVERNTFPTILPSMAVQPEPPFQPQPQLPSKPAYLAQAAEAAHTALYGGYLSPVAAPGGTPYLDPSREGLSREDIKTNPIIPNEMTMKLELAKNYFEIGDDESALALLEDVASRGTDWEKQTAQRLLVENAAEGIT